jgi:hypothetical protein
VLTAHTNPAISHYTNLGTNTPRGGTTYAYDIEEIPANGIRRVIGFGQIEVPK